MTAEASKKQHYHLVKFAHGDAAGTVERYTDWSADVTYDSATWTSKPQLAITFPANTGTLDEKALVLELPLEGSSNDLFEDLVSGEPFSPVYVTVIHGSLALPDDAGADEHLIVCLNWRVVKATKNPAGKRGIVRLEAVSPKARMKVSLGLAATPTCQWTLFGNGCALTRATYVDTGTLTAIDGTDNKKVTITGVSVSVPGGTPGDTFRFGYVEKDGIRIQIREWTSGASTTFYLRRKPPAAWVGATVTVVPGCDKTITTCRNRWDNEERFQGCGYAIPDYHPVHESPA